MKLNNPVSGVYKITNNVTGRVYIGESICIQSRLATHFQQLSINNHINYGMQSDWNSHGADSFEHNVLEIVIGDKSDLRRKESQFIADYLNSGHEVYNGQNQAFLHVKGERDESKRRLLKNNQGNVPGHSELYRSGESDKRKAGIHLESSQTGSDASDFNPGIGTEGANNNARSNRPASESLDENGQLKQGSNDYLQPLPNSGYCEEDIGIDDYLFDDGSHLIVPINEDEYDDLLYALYTYLPQATKERLSKDIVKHLLFADFESQAQLDKLDAMLQAYDMTLSEFTIWKAEQWMPLESLIPGLTRV